MKRLKFWLPFPEEEGPTNSNLEFFLRNLLFCPCSSFYCFQCDWWISLPRFIDLRFFLMIVPHVPIEAKSFSPCFSFCCRSACAININKILASSDNQTSGLVKSEFKPDAGLSLAISFADQQGSCRLLMLLPSTCVRLPQGKKVKVQGSKRR